MPAIDTESSQASDPTSRALRTRSRNWSRIEAGLGIGALLFVIAVIADFILNGPKAKQIEQDLSAQLSQIQPPEGALLVSSSADSKPRQAGAGRTYRCSLSRTSVAAYYDRQLRERGWVPYGRGSPILEYRKGSYHATLEFRGDIDWTFAMDLAWRSSW